MKQIAYIRTVGTTGIAWLCLVHWYYRPRTLRLQSWEVQDIIKAANIRLSKMTNDRYTLKRKIELSIFTFDVYSEPNNLNNKNKMYLLKRWRSFRFTGQKKILIKNILVTPHSDNRQSSQNQRSVSKSTWHIHIIRSRREAGLCPRSYKASPHGAELK